MIHESDIVPHVVCWKLAGSGGTVAVVSLNTVVAQVDAPAPHGHDTQVLYMYRARISMSSLLQDFPMLHAT